MVPGQPHLHWQQEGRLWRPDRIRAHRLRLHPQQCCCGPNILTTRLSDTRRQCLYSGRARREECGSRGGSKLEGRSWRLRLLENQGLIRRRQSRGERPHRTERCQRKALQQSNNRQATSRRRSAASSVCRTAHAGSQFTSLRRRRQPAIRFHVQRYPSI